MQYLHKYIYKTVTGYSYVYDIYCYLYNLNIVNEPDVLPLIGGHWTTSGVCLRGDHL